MAPTPALCSDAKEVLFKKHGLEPAAAQLLDHTLLLCSASRPSDAALAQNGGAMPGSDASSFLTALLGPELEAVAISKARQNSWRAPECPQGFQRQTSPLHGWVCSVPCFFLMSNHANELPSQNYNMPAKRW
eukprot:1144859-Pelagomonas_calceolata.AAC.1